MKRLLVSGAAAFRAVAVPAAAPGQDRCGASYTIELGDTLYRVSQTCRVGLTRI